MRFAAGTESRTLLLRSLAPMARAAGAGLGPYGRVTLHGDEREVRVLRTGADVARFLADSAGPASLAPRLVRDIVAAAERELGDGTGRLVVLFHALLEAGTRHIASGVSPHALADALQRAVGAFVEALRRSRLRDPSFAAVARTAGADAGLADAVAALALEIGSGGNLEVIEHDRPGIETVTGEGFVFDAETVSQALPAIGLDPVNVLVANERIDNFGQLAPFLEAFATRGKALLIVARDVSGPALQALIQNRKKIGLRAVALRPAAVTDEAAGILDDLAVATGADLIATERGTSLEILRPSMLGRAARFTFSNGRATLIGTGGDAAAIARRRDELLALAEAKKYLALDRDRLQRRAGRIDGRWGELRIGRTGAYDTQANLGIARRAAAAVRSAMDGGVIAGGPAGLLAALEDPGAPGPQDRAAHDCLANALLALRRTLQRNAPGSEGDVAPVEIPAPDADIQDPFMLVAAVLERAASGAATLLRAEAILSKS